MSNVLVIDNYDSFTFNLVEEFHRLNCEVLVHRNDVSVSRVESLVNEQDISLMVLSPGPGTPEKAGCCLNLIRRFLNRCPILGICLGEQCIVHALGGTVEPAAEVLHGKSSQISHDNQGLFEGLPDPLRAGRYHSLSAQELPEELEISAESESGEIMGVRHRKHPVFGIQFHPESILTPRGRKLIESSLSFT